MWGTLFIWGMPSVYVRYTICLYKVSYLFMWGILSVYMRYVICLCEVYLFTWGILSVYMRSAICLYEVYYLFIWYYLFMRYTICLYEVCHLFMWGILSVYMRYAICLCEVYCLFIWGMLSMWGMLSVYMRYAICLYEVCYLYITRWTDETHGISRVPSLSTETWSRHFPTPTAVSCMLDCIFCTSCCFFVGAGDLFHFRLSGEIHFNAVFYYCMSVAEFHSLINIIFSKAATEYRHWNMYTGSFMKSAVTVCSCLYKL